MGLKKHRLRKKTEADAYSYKCLLCYDCPSINHRNKLIKIFKTISKSGKLRSNWNQQRERKRRKGIVKKEIGDESTTKPVFQIRRPERKLLWTADLENKEVCNQVVGLWLWREG